MHHNKATNEIYDEIDQEGNHTHINSINHIDSINHIGDDSPDWQYLLTCRFFENSIR